MALTDSVNVEEKDGVLVDSPVAAGAVIFRGAMVIYNTNGYLAAAVTGAGTVFAGVAEEEVDNTSGSAGDTRCKHKTEGNYLFSGAGFVQADVGKFVHALDDETITKTSTNNPRVGQIVEFVSATSVWVKLARNPNSAGL